jgi:hypothetical protein
MRCFLTVSGHTDIGIPISAVEEILHVPCRVSSCITADMGRKEFLFSLAHFFGASQPSAPYGLLLKNDCAEAGLNCLREITGEPFRRLVLLTNPIETESDIPDEYIKEMPCFLRKKGRLRFFLGGTFTASTFISVVDPAVLVSCMIKSVR